MSFDCNYVVDTKEFCNNATGECIASTITALNPVPIDAASHKVERTYCAHVCHVKILHIKYNSPSRDSFITPVTMRKSVEYEWKIDDKQILQSLKAMGQ